MDRRQVPSDEPALAERLAEYDEQLTASGAEPAGVPADEAGESAGRAEWEHLKDFLHVVHRAWSGDDTPAAPSSTTPVGETTRPVDAEGATIKVGRFEIRRELARGGFGTVYLAYDPTVRRQLALKIPHPELLLSEAHRQRFAREAEAAGALDHPNIVPVYEAGTAGSVSYIASPYCEGPTLTGWLAARGGLVPQRAAAGLLAELADAVDYAHVHGVLHRDIKPSNVLLEPKNGDGQSRSDATAELDELRPRLTDFGLAKLVTSDTEATRSGMLVGTAKYMAPEQAEARATDFGPATDIYALGVILYELLAGRTPFVGTSDFDVLRKVIHDEPVSLSRLQDGVPRDLNTICLKCLEKSPHRRYAKAADLADDLRRFLEGKPIHARPAGVLEAAWKWARRRPATAALVAVSAAAVLTISLGGIYYTARLGLALDDANRLQELAVERESRVREYLYATDMKLAYRAWLDSDVPQTLELLSRHRPEAGRKDLRCFVWRYLWRLCHQDQMTLVRHDGDVYAAAYSPNGTTLATAGRDGTARLWDVESGQVRMVINGHAGEVNAVAFTPDGTTLATCSDDGTVRLWDAQTGSELVRLEGHEHFVLCLAISPDGELLAAGGRDHTVRVWDLETAEQVAVLQGHERTIECVAFSPDGETLATSGLDETVKLWDVSSWQVQSEMTGHAGAVVSLAFSHNGRLLATGSEDRTVILWDSTTGEEMATLKGHTDTVQCVAFAPHDSLLVSAGKDGTARLWDVASGTEITRFQGHTGRLWYVAFAPDGETLATAGGDGTVKVWGARDRSEPARLRGELGAVRSVCFAPDASHVVTTSAANFFGRLSLRDVPSGRLEEIIEIPNAGNVNCVAYSPDGKTLAAACNPLVALYDPASGKEKAVLEGHALPTYSVAFSPDGKTLASASYDQTIKLWDVQALKERATLRGHTAGVEAVAFSPDGSMLASGSTTEEVRIWDVATGRQLDTLRGHSAGIRSVTFSPDGRLLATASSDRTVKLWNVVSRAERATLRGHVGEVFSVAFSPDAKTLATASDDGTVKLWQVATGQEILTLDAGSQKLLCVAFSPDGQLLGAGGMGSDQTGELLLWSTRLDTPQVISPAAD